MVCFVLQRGLSHAEVCSSEHADPDAEEGNADADTEEGNADAGEETDDNAEACRHGYADAHAGGTGG